jgi:hypothetical protein
MSRRGWGPGRAPAPGLLAIKLAPGERWCRRGELPGGQGRMSGTSPSRRSTPAGHTSLTARPGPARAGRSSWRGGTRLRRVLLRWQAPQACRSRPGATAAEAVDPYVIPYALGVRTPHPPDIGSPLVIPPWGIGDGLDHLELHQPIGQQPQRPALAPFRRRAARQRHQAGLLLPVQPAAILARGRFCGTRWRLDPPRRTSCGPGRRWRG